MEFCPTCANMLQYERRERSCRFFCPTCPYVCQIENKVKIKRKQKLVKKTLESIITQQDMLKGGAETDATCPNCNHGRALFRLEQIRSADEPATRFYMCLNERCGNKWSEE